MAPSWERTANIIFKVHFWELTEDTTREDSFLGVHGRYEEPEGLAQREKKNQGNVVS